MPKKSKPFWDRIEIHSTDECWPWLGSLTLAGYGTYVPSRGKRFVAHRVAYEKAIGPIPEGLVLDHLCRNRACCNPEHLEPVTIGENVLRGETLSAANLKKTHCPRGHEYTPENTYVVRRRGKKPCRECRQCKLRPAPPRTHCDKGHELTPENIWTPPSQPTWKTCRTCMREKNRRNYQARKARGVL